MTEAVAHSFDSRLGVAKTEGPSVQAGDVVRHLSHELRQPLSTIESIAYYLGMVLPGEEKITLQLERLRYLVDQMNWSLSDAVHLLQAAPTNPQLLDLHELVSEVLAERASLDGPRFRADFAETEALVEMDAGQASHMIRGLLLALGELPGEQDIMVRTAVSDGRVRLEVQVPRAEAPAGNLENWFDPLPEKLPGGVLSLACARRIAQAHRGTIEASYVPQLGVRFLCSFPSVE